MKTRLKRLEVPSAFRFMLDEPDEFPEETARIKKTELLADVEKFKNVGDGWFLVTRGTQKRCGIWYKGHLYKSSVQDFEYQLECLLVRTLTEREFNAIKYLAVCGLATEAQMNLLRLNEQNQEIRKILRGKYRYYKDDE